MYVLQWVEIGDTLIRSLVSIIPIRGAESIIRARLKIYDDNDALWEI